MKNKFIYIILLITISCMTMAIVDSALNLDYIYKSIIKLILFISLPILYSIYDKDFSLRQLITLNKKGLFNAIILGVFVYVIILGGYFITNNTFDFSNIVPTLDKNIGVNIDNFIWVSIYISFINSFLEEFFFRGFSFYSLKKYKSRKFAYIFSSLSFALYHVAMMIGWFNIIIFSIVMLGLVLGGLILNYVNEKNNNIYTSWLIHMFANFAINTVGFILMGII